MEYTSHTDESRRELLKAIDVASLDDLLAGIPDDVRQKEPLKLREGLPESEVDELLSALAGQNAVPPAVLSFLGGGAYDHHIPAALDHVASRSEFYTAYTPYQAEVAQGTLQATYEFQSLIRRLTGMDIAQASLYDCGSAIAEAALLAMTHTNRHHVVLAGTLNPRHRGVLETYLTAQGVTLDAVSGPDGRTDFARLNEVVTDQTACVIMASPNYLGGLDDWSRGADVAHAHGALMVAVFHPISLGILKPPGDCGVDIAVGEGQCLGNPVSFGGPLLGLFAVRREFVRRIPGRLIGRTVDAQGQTAYVMTLQTREQHIRREKATSNICTAQALLATRAAIYMSLLGRRGLAQLAQTCIDRAHYLAVKINALDGYSVPLGPNFFNEFVVESSLPAGAILAALRERDILGGIDLGGYSPGFEHRFLVCVTEKHTRTVLDKFVEALVQAGVKDEGRPAPSSTFAQR